MISSALQSLGTILEDKGYRLGQIMNKNKQFSKFLDGKAEPEIVERLGELVAEDLLYYKNKVIPFIKHVQDEFNVAFTNQYTNNLYVDLEIAKDPIILEKLKEKLEEENKDVLENPEIHTPITFEFDNLDENPEIKDLLTGSGTDFVTDYVNLLVNKKTARELKDYVNFVNNIPLSRVEFNAKFSRGNPSLATDEESINNFIMVYALVKTAENRETRFNSGFEGYERAYGTIYSNLLQAITQAISYYNSLKATNILYLNSISKKDEFDKTHLKVVVIEQPYLEFLERTKDHPQAIDALLGLHKSCNPQLPRLDADTIAVHIDNLASGYLKRINSANVASTNSRVQSSKSILLDAFRNAISILPEEFRKELDSGQNSVTNFIIDIEKALNDHYQDFIDNDIYKIIVTIADKYIFKDSNIVEFAMELDKASSYCQNPDKVSIGLLNKIAVINLLIKRLVLSNMDR